MLFAAEFLSGFGVMVLDISIGAIFAAVIPDSLRSRVSGAFQAVNYGTRPVGALLGGLLGSMIGMRPALWIATVGGALAFCWLLPSPLPRFRMPVAAEGAPAQGRAGEPSTAAGPSTAGERSAAGEPSGSGVPAATSRPPAAGEPSASGDLPD
jgi:MFS family permease